MSKLGLSEISLLPEALQRYRPAMRERMPQVEQDWKDYSAAAGPALLGCAAGILIGEALDSGAKRPVFLSLALAGVAALAPNLVASAIERVAGPGTKIGERSRLEGIRGAHAPYEGDEFGVEVDHSDLGV